jgi:hypothetical protein
VFDTTDSDSLPFLDLLACALGAASMLFVLFSGARLRTEIPSRGSVDALPTETGQLIELWFDRSSPRLASTSAKDAVFQGPAELVEMEPLVVMPAAASRTVIELVSLDCDDREPVLAVWWKDGDAYPARTDNLRKYNGIKPCRMRVSLSTPAIWAGQGCGRGTKGVESTALAGWSGQRRILRVDSLAALCALLATIDSDGLSPWDLQGESEINKEDRLSMNHTGPLAETLNALAAMMKALSEEEENGEHCRVTDGGGWSDLCHHVNLGAGQWSEALRPSYVRPKTAADVVGFDSEPYVVGFVARRTIECSVAKVAIPDAPTFGGAACWVAEAES